jgi:energy-coupling factor transport system ATP-binding protein
MIAITDLRQGPLRVESLGIPNGTTAVIGPNGSGKTTLLKLCAGILLPAQGTIRINGIPPRDAEIGWVNEFPDRNMIFGRVSDEVASPLRFRHIPDEEVESRTSGLLETMGIARLASRRVRELSGGEKVLVALAAAVIHRPALLVMDECDSHLDPARTRQIDRILPSLSIPHILRCTQDPEIAAQGDHLIYLEDGRICHAGTPQDVFTHLGGSPFCPISWRCGYAPRT